MKITRISVYCLDLPLSYWLTGGGLQFDSLDATFVKLETDAGLTGWGEATPWGQASGEAYGPGVRAGLETLAPAILGCDPRRLEEVERAMDLRLPGNLYAKAPVDMACWDIAGQAAGLSIAAMLGADRHDDGSKLGSLTFSTEPETMLEFIKRYRARGYRVHSVRLGGDVAKDIARIRFLEAHRLPEERMFYDAGGAWTRREAAMAMTAVAELGVTIEQPTRSLDDIVELRSLAPLPISAGASLVTLQNAARIAREGLAEVFCIQLNRVGGLTKDLHKNNY